jgi:hypothetical protein
MGCTENAALRSSIKEFLCGDQGPRNLKFAHAIVLLSFIWYISGQLLDPLGIRLQLSTPALAQIEMEPFNNRMLDKIGKTKQGSDNENNPHTNQYKNYSYYHNTYPYFDIPPSHQARHGQIYNLVESPKNAPTASDHQIGDFYASNTNFVDLELFAHKLCDTEINEAVNGFYRNSQGTLQQQRISRGQGSSNMWDQELPLLSLHKGRNGDGLESAHDAQDQGPRDRMFNSQNRFPGAQAGLGVQANESSYALDHTSEPINDPSVAIQISSHLESSSIGHTPTSLSIMAI